MKHATIYDRASTDMQANNFSRFDAATTGFELAAKYGYTAELKQEIKSGESITNRPVLQSILDDVVAGKVQAIIVQNLSRLTRDQDGIDAYVIKKILSDNGCIVITQEKVYDFSLDTDDKAADIGFLMGRWYKADLIRNSVQGQKARAKSGLPVAGQTPYGYKTVHIMHNGKMTTDWAKNEAETEAVLKVFELYPGYGARGTANKLNEAGYTRRNGKPWRTVEVWRMIRNTLYCGFLQWCKEKKCRFLRDFETTNIHRSDLAYVSVEIWEKCQQVKRERKRDLPSAGKWSKNPLAGLLACPYCGGPMYGHANGGGYLTYGCIANSKMGRSACIGKRYSKRIADKAAIELVAQIFDDYLLKEVALRDALDKYGKNVSEEELRRQIEVELFVITESKKRLVKAVAGGTLSEDDIREEMQDLRDKETRLNRESATIHQKAKVREDYSAALNSLMDRDIRQTLEKMDADILRQFFRLVFKPQSIKLEVTGKSSAARAKVIAYECTEEFQELLGAMQNECLSARPCQIRYPTPRSLQRTKQAGKF